MFDETRAQAKSYPALAISHTISDREIKNSEFKRIVAFAESLIKKYSDVMSEEQRTRLNTSIWGCKSIKEYVGRFKAIMLVRPSNEFLKAVASRNPEWIK